MEDDEIDSENLCVEVRKVADGYVERDAEGLETHYVKADDARELTIENPEVTTHIDARSGVRHFSIHGAIQERIRAIGNAVEFSSIDAFIESGKEPGVATIELDYSTWRSAVLSLQISDTCAAEVVRALRDTKPGTISIAVAGGQLWGASDDDGGALLLPWLDEQEKMTEGGDVIATFRLTVSGLAVIRRSDDPWSIEVQQTRIADPVGIYYSAGHPLRSALDDLRTYLASLDRAVHSLTMAVIFFAIVLLIRLW